MWWHTLIGIATGLLILWVGMLALLWRAAGRDRDVDFTQALRLVPDMVRLLHRLATRRGVPWRARLILVLLLAYLACPIDLVPDVIPVLGYLDDAIVVVLAVRAVSRHAGVATVAAHWPGTPEGLRAFGRLVGVDLSAVQRAEAGQVEAEPADAHSLTRA